jgi:hypothetical protein
MYGGEQKCKQIFGGELCRKDTQLDKQGVDVGIILKQILKQ